MTPIELCAVCTKLEQRLELNYQKNEARPAAYDALVPLGKRRGFNEDDTSEAWWEHVVLRCPSCGTIYTAYHSVDPGHSFMDPTHDTESIERRSPHAARQFLASFETPEAAVAADELSSREGVLLDELSTMLATPGRAPTWHVQRHAIDSLMDAFLAARDFERLERLLLRHEDPVVRAAAAGDLVNEAFYGYSWRKPLAHEVVTSRGVVPCLASVLAAPSRATWAFSQNAYRATTTHAVATQGVGTAVHHDVPIDDAMVDRLVLLLETESWEAASALRSVMLKSPQQARRLWPVLQALPPETFTRDGARDLVSFAQREAAKTAP